jgi:integrase
MAFCLRGKISVDTNDLSPKEATEMSHEVKYIGMDVHKEAIVIAVLDGSGKLVMETILEARWEKGNKPEEGWAWPAPTKSGHAEHDSIRVQHKNAIKASKVVKFVVYSFRHTFLTRLGESGCDTWTLARIAGHSSIKMSERYVHPSNDAVLSAMSRMPQPELPTSDTESSDQ